MSRERCRGGACAGWVVMLPQAPAYNVSSERHVSWLVRWHDFRRSGLAGELGWAELKSFCQSWRATP